MGSRRIIATEEAEEDIRIEGSLRPQSLDEYIGQEKAKNNLKILYVNLNPAPPLLDFGQIVGRVCGENLLKLDFPKIQKDCKEISLQSL